MMGTAPISHPSSPPVSLSQYYSSLLVDLEKEEDDDDDEWLWEGESALDPAEDFRSLATEGGSFTTKPDSARKSARRRSTEERKSTIVAIDDTSDRHVSSMSSPRSPLQATIPPFFTSPSYFTPFQNSLLKYYQHHCRSLYKNLPSFEDLWVLGNRVGRAELSV